MEKHEAKRTTRIKKTKTHAQLLIGPAEVATAAGWLSRPEVLRLCRCWDPAATLTDLNPSPF